MNKRNEGGYQGKTEYEFMMQTFSWPGDNIHPATAAECFAINMMYVEISTSFTGATSAGAASVILQSSRHRNSKLKMIGAALCERLLDSSRKRQRRKCSNLEDDRAKTSVVASLESSLPHLEMRECLDNSKIMEYILLSCGGDEHTVATIRNFKDRKEICRSIGYKLADRKWK